MARKRHSLESIGAVLRRVEAGVPIAELAHKAGRLISGKRSTVSSVPPRSARSTS